MDAFRALTGGGVRFDKKRFRNDVDTFERQERKKVKVGAVSDLPKELDFFGTSTEGVREGEEKENAEEEEDLELEGLSKNEKKKKKKKERKVKMMRETPTDVDYAAILRQHRIKYTGLEPPNPIPSLATLALHAPLIPPADLKLTQSNWENMGLGVPTGAQMGGWGVMMANRDLLLCAPTGSGKTMAFILPLLLLNPPTLPPAAAAAAAASTSPEASTSKVPLKPTSIILEPTRELAMQVRRETTRVCEGGKWRLKVLGGEVKQGKHKKAQKKGSKKGKEAAVALIDVEEEPEDAEGERGADEESDEVEGCDILITTPLRLVYAIKEGTVSLTRISHLVLDELDHLFSLNFLPQTDSILSSCLEHNKDLRKSFFSATIPSSVEEMAKASMTGEIRCLVGHKDSATETIAQTLQFVGTEEHKLAVLCSLITSGQFTPPVLIFVQSILRAKELSTELIFDGINCDCIHADRSSEERDQVVRDFAQGKVWCLVATDVMSRGVDFKGVKLVVNYDFPQSGGSYIHRIGRTGRAGKDGKAITFFTKADATYLKSIVNIMRLSGCPVPPYMLELKAPSQDEKKRLKLKPIGRKDVSRTNGAGGGAKEDRKGVGKKRERVMQGDGAWKAKEGREGKKGREKVATKGEGKGENKEKRKKARDVEMDE